MYIEDYLVVIEGVLSHLNDYLNVHPTTIMGHSLGGLEVIMLQDKLVKIFKGNSQLFIYLMPVFRYFIQLSWLWGVYLY